MLFLTHAPPAEKTALIESRFKEQQHGDSAAFVTYLQQALEAARSEIVQMKADLRTKVLQQLSESGKLRETEACLHASDVKGEALAAAAVTLQSKLDDCNLKLEIAADELKAVTAAATAAIAAMPTAVMNTPSRRRLRSPQKQVSISAIVSDAFTAIVLPPTCTNVVFTSNPLPTVVAVPAVGPLSSIRDLPAEAMSAAAAPVISGESSSITTFFPLVRDLSSLSFIIYCSPLQKQQPQRIVGLPRRLGQ